MRFVDMPRLDSSAVEFVRYDDRQRQLIVGFRGRNRPYCYEGVPPRVYRELITAESAGRYFNAHIRDRYPFTEL
ncbi:MAG TPA: KTSC domain-containing protein [Rhizomicrobium sp.]|jgi:lysyl-tRNA synthetase class 2|nr:KTSC domain-containing protein [Rhizomicrobium sp.]